MSEKFYLMSFLLMDIHVKQMQGMTINQLDGHIKDAMDLVDRVYEAGKDRKWVLPPRTLEESWAENEKVKAFLLEKEAGKNEIPQSNSTPPLAYVMDKSEHEGILRNKI